MTHFDYLLNAFEAASQSDSPAKEGYSEKRRSLFAYVREIEECRMDAERYRTALEQIVAPFEDLNFVSGNKPLTYIHDVATDALAAKESE